MAPKALYVSLKLQVLSPIFSLKLRQLLFASQLTSVALPSRVLLPTLTITFSLGKR